LGADNVLDTTAAVTARCFGDFSVRINGRPVENWHAGKARNLFQYLLLNRDRVVRREKLFDVLWPDGECSPSGSSLKVAMHSVRRALEHTGGPAGPAIDIVNRDHGYLLRSKDLWLDLEEFDRCVDNGRAAETRGAHADALDSYRQAVALYTDDFLAAESGDWISEQREYNRALALHALTRLRADALHRRDLPAVIKLCRRILRIDPYHEEVYQSLMLAHGRRGELGQVRNWHQICVRRLTNDLDVTPTATTRRIFHRAVRGELRRRPGES
jgi:two-component SAPR family response regulator